MINKDVYIDCLMSERAVVKKSISIVVNERALHWFLQIISVYLSWGALLRLWKLLLHIFCSLSILHYGKCRMCVFGAWPIQATKSQDILASAAQILNVIFLKHLFSFILIVERRHEIIGDMEQGETPQLALNQWLWT